MRAGTKSHLCLKPQHGTKHITAGTQGHWLNEWIKLFSQETRAPRVSLFVFLGQDNCRILFPVGRLYFLFFLIEWPVGHILRMVWVFAWGPTPLKSDSEIDFKLPSDIWNLCLKKISKKKSHISSRQAALGNQAPPSQDPRSILEYRQNLFGI